MKRLPIIFFVVFALTSPAFASGGIGDTDIIWRTVNFLVLVGLLYYFLADKVRHFFSERREGIKHSLEKADEERKEAKNMYSTYSEKIEKASGEIEKIAESIKTQGTAERDKIIAEAVKMAQKIKEDTKARMEQEYKEASAKLRKEAVQLSVAMAEEILRRKITAEDNEVIVQEYIEKVVVKQ
ncbi:MAG: F0F1 ATP synthase subunit B [Deltaproteobacteria bacterium]|nr:F0F1 ATP synthase subunit B [Deltaproteobacteria bacterium]